MHGMHSSSRKTSRRSPIMLAGTFFEPCSGARECCVPVTAMTDTGRWHLTVRGEHARLECVTVGFLQATW